MIMCSTNINRSKARREAKGFVHCRIGDIGLGDGIDLYFQQCVGP